MSSANTQPETLNLVDSHAHLDDEQFDSDRAQVIDVAMSRGVHRIINIGYEPERWTTSLQLASDYPAIQVALGMHPGSVEQWNADARAELERLLPDHRVVAIGECGIDLFRGETNLEEQERCFREQLALACKLSLPLIIHMRAAETEVLRVLSDTPELPALLFHSFEGTENLTAFVLERQALVGVGGLATRPKSVTIRQQLQRIPLQQMVLETDSPYLPPAAVKGRRNTPASIPVIAEFLADLKGISAEEVANTTTTNVDAFFTRLNKV